MELIDFSNMYRNFIFKSDFGEFVIFKILSSELYQIKKVICYCFLWFYGIYLFPCFVSNKVYMFVYFKTHIFFVKLNSVRWGGRGFPPPTLRKKNSTCKKSRQIAAILMNTWRSPEQPVGLTAILKTPDFTIVNYHASLC